MAAILKFSFQENPLRMTALQRPRYYYGVLSMHNQKMTNFYQQKQGYPNDYRGYLHNHIDFTDKHTKKHTLHPIILGVRDRETSFAAFKGLMMACVTWRRSLWLERISGHLE